MNIGDKFSDIGGATRIVTDLVNGGEEVGFKFEGAAPGSGTGKCFQSAETFAKETVAKLVHEEPTPVIPAPVSEPVMPPSEAPSLIQRAVASVTKKKR